MWPVGQRRIDYVTEGQLGSAIGLPNNRCWPGRGKLMRSSWFLCVAFLGIAAMASDHIASGKLLRVGVFDEEFLKEVSEGSWQALCPATDGLGLSTTMVRMTPAPPFAGSDEGPAPRKHVEALECPKAIVLIRLGSLVDGHVSTAFNGTFQLVPDAEKLLDVGTSSYRLAARKTTPDTLELVLRSREVEQRISVVGGCCNDAYPTLLWAGDMDRDGKIDLLLDITNHYASSNYVLFLSSAADASHLVTEVAHFRSGSC